MSDRDDKLRAAILKALIDSREYTTWHVPADAVLAAVNAVLEESETVEWGARCVKREHGHREGGGVYQVSPNQCDVAEYIGLAAEDYELVSRRLWTGPWEAML